MATETEYVDAGIAVDFRILSAGFVGKAPAVARGVSYDRILKARDAEAHNWLTYYGAYDGQRYSTLDQINSSNVKALTPVWEFQCGSVGMHSGASTYSFEASPLVVDGIMYLTGWDGWVWALDATTGVELWRYHRASPYDVRLCCGNVNRGCAVAEGKVFVTTLNAHVLALDATNGGLVWDQVYGDVRAGESATVAPLIVKDMVIVGSSGGEFGVRGHLDAFKLETGERVWRCYMVPAPGEPGSETWPGEGEAWARGGANPWVTPTYDPELNLLYVGTGNPSPVFDGGVRAGDNLYTDCVVAVDPDKGQIRSHYQYTPHDVWGYDSTMENILFEMDGRKCLGHFDKNGYFFVLDRTDCSLIRVVPFVDRITWGEIDSNGKVTPRVFPDKEGDPVHFWPGPGGAKEWTHAAYSPKTELFYVPVQDLGATATRRRREFKESIPYWGAGLAVDTEDVAGTISAFDPRTGQEKWRFRQEHPMTASVLVTAGDLVLAGDPAGIFRAFNANTGELLWAFNCGSGHHSSPCTYSVDGRQYIAVPVGYGARTEDFYPGGLATPAGSALLAFALPELNGHVPAFSRGFELPEREKAEVREFTIGTMSRVSVYFGRIRYADAHPAGEPFPVRAAVTAARSVARDGHQLLLGNIEVRDEARLVYGRLGYAETEDLTQQDYDEENHRFVEKRYRLPNAASSGFALNYATGAVAFEVGPKISPTVFVNQLLALLNGTEVGEFQGELVRVAADYREFLRNVDKVTRIAFEVRPTNPRDREIFRPLDRGMKASNANRERVAIENKEEGLTVDPPGNYDEPNPNPALQGIAMVEEGFGSTYRIDAEAQGHPVRYDSTTGALLTDVVTARPEDLQELFAMLGSALDRRAEQLQPGHGPAAPLKVDDESDANAKDSGDEWLDSE